MIKIQSPESEVFFQEDLTISAHPKLSFYLEGGLRIWLPSRKVSRHLCGLGSLPPTPLLPVQGRPSCHRSVTSHESGSMNQSSCFLSDQGPELAFAFLLM